MDSQLVEDLARELLEKNDLASFLKLSAVQVWNRIEFVRDRKYLRLNETTLTQNLLFDFWQLAKGTNLPIELYEAKNEKANGNDLEIFVETHEGFLFFPCQAKIIRNNNRYISLHHGNKSNATYQMDLLTDYAKLNSGQPIYLLYNHYSDLQKSIDMEEQVGFPLEFFGCSIVSAHYLKQHFPPEPVVGKSRRVVPSFQDLHPHPAIPLHEFVSAIQTGGEQDIKFFLEKGKPYYFSRSEMLADSNWRNLNPVPAIGFITDEQQVRNKKTPGELDFPGFKPGYRLVFPYKKAGTRIMYLS